MHVVTCEAWIATGVDAYHERLGMGNLLGNVCHLPYALAAFSPDFPVAQHLASPSANTLGSLATSGLAPNKSTITNALRNEPASDQKYGSLL
jgi:hypothetical protein